MSESGQPDNPVPAYHPTGSTPPQLPVPQLPAPQWAAPAAASDQLPAYLPMGAPSAPAPPPAQPTQPVSYPPGNYPPGNYPPAGPYSAYYDALPPDRPARWPAISAIIVLVLALGVGTALVVRHLNSGHSSAAAPSQPDLTAMNLTSSDLPGWSIDPDTSDDGDDGDVQATCPQLGADPVPVLGADSPKFTLDDTTVRSSISSFATAGVVSSDVRRLSNPDVPGCLKQSVEDEFAKQATADNSSVRASGTTVTVTPAPPGSPQGDVATIAVRASLANGSASTDIALDEILIATGRVEAVILIEQIGSDIPAGLEASLTKDVAARVIGNS